MDAKAKVPIREGCKLIRPYLKRMELESIFNQYGLVVSIDNYGLLVDSTYAKVKFGCLLDFGKRYEWEFTAMFMFDNNKDFDVMITLPESTLSIEDLLPQGHYYKNWASRPLIKMLLVEVGKLKEYILDDLIINPESSGA